MAASLGSASRSVVSRCHDSTPSARSCSMDTASFGVRLRIAGAQSAWDIWQVTLYDRARAPFLRKHAQRPQLVDGHRLARALWLRIRCWRCRAPPLGAPHRIRSLAAQHSNENAVRAAGYPRSQEHSSTDARTPGLLYCCIRPMAPGAATGDVAP